MAERAAGITAVAAVFLLTAAYLLAIGVTMLARPGLVSMSAGAEFLGGLELAGPYMFLLAAGIGVAVARGLLRLHRWARWAAILIAMIGIVMLIPSVSSAILDFRIGRLGWSGLGVIVRAMIVWYLSQPRAGEAFL